MRVFIDSLVYIFRTYMVMILHAQVIHRINHVLEMLSYIFSAPYKSRLLCDSWGQAIVKK